MEKEKNKFGKFIRELFLLLFQDLPSAYGCFLSASQSLYEPEYRHIPASDSSCLGAVSVSLLETTQEERQSDKTTADIKTNALFMHLLLDEKPE